MYSRIMIAGTGSDCGKTTVTCALLAALKSLGKGVIPFKCGPDYIDPLFHRKATGVESRNLDVFLMGEDGVRHCLARHAAQRDICLIEGVMGFYDGLGNGSFSSSHHVSMLTNTPVILIVSVKGTALSVCATIKGFMDFEENNIRGVILNNVSEAMFGFYQHMIEERLNVKVIGFMPYIWESQIESRHLGLVAADEISDIKEKINVLSENALRCININALLDIARQAGPFDLLQDFLQDFLPPSKGNRNINLYVANDEAFSFWYEDNHDLFREMGANIKFFSPVHDKSLPDDADGLIFWGGYPELHGAEIEKNHGMKDSLRSAIQGGIPVYAEGGGFLYLQESLTDLHDIRYEMLGVLPGHSRMTSKLQNFGYYVIEAQRDNILCKKGERTNTHFFHRSASDNEGDCFIAVKQGGKSFPCIISESNIIAGYQHLHFWLNPGFAKNYMAACYKYQHSQTKLPAFITAPINTPIDTPIDTPIEIEKRSLEIISKRLEGRYFDPKNLIVIKRVIHTTADFDYADNLIFSDNVVDIAKMLLKNGTLIVTDTQMAKSGINKKAAEQLGCDIHCFIDAPEVEKTAKANGCTRSRAAVDMAAQTLGNPAIFVVGNAPTALIRLYELRDVVTPALIIAVPVGFVNVIESKELILKLSTPHIVSMGQKGGSTVAAAICNALLYEATGRLLL